MIEPCEYCGEIHPEGECKCPICGRKHDPEQCGIWICEGCDEKFCFCDVCPGDSHVASYEDDQCALEGYGSCEGFTAPDGMHIHVPVAPLNLDWSRVFTPSERYGEGVWEDDLRLGRLPGIEPVIPRVVMAPGLGFEPNYEAHCPYADGGAFWYRPVLTCMTGLYEAGDWVVGWAALRFLCHVYGLKPPDHLDGEPFVPDTGRLVQLTTRRIQANREPVEILSWMLPLRPGVLVDDGRYSVNLKQPRAFWDELSRLQTAGRGDDRGKNPRNTE